MEMSARWRGYFRKKDAGDVAQIAKEAKANADTQNAKVDFYRSHKLPVDPTMLVSAAAATKKANEARRVAAEAKQLAGIESETAHIALF